MRRIVLRGTLGAAVFGVVAVFALILLADAVIRGAWAVAAAGASVFAAILWWQWWLLVSPALVVTTAGVQVVSALRTQMVAWDDVAEVTPSFVTTIRRTDGRRVRAWGAPTTGVDRVLGVGHLGVAKNQPTSVLVAAARDQLEDLGVDPKPADVRSGWRWRAALLGVGLAGLALLVTTQLAR